MIDVQKIHKRYGQTHAVKGVSFTLQKGDFVGFVGGNGAGKSTTIKMLTAQVVPTDGEIVIDGENIIEHPELAREKVGYVPEFPSLYEYLTGREMLEFVCDVRRSGQMDWGMEIAGLGDDIDRLIREYSQGMRRKIAIAAAMVSKPPVLILDEALNGLDPSSVKRIVSLLHEQRNEGTCIMLSTHVLDTLEKVATRLLVIDDGLLIENCGIEELDRIREQL